MPRPALAPVKKISIIVVMGDRGLYGGYKNFILKKAEHRMKELRELSVAYTIANVGKKGNSYFKHRLTIPVDKLLETGSMPTTKEAQAIADDIFILFISEEVDKVKLLYTKFVSLIKSEPVIHTLLPLSPKGEVCDINGVCVDASEDEMFRLTTKEGEAYYRERNGSNPDAGFLPRLALQARLRSDSGRGLLSLYLNSQILRAL
jgi:F-type H+-transporting ATPase subunit gamma